MKESRYTTRIPYKGKIIYFNTLRRNFLMVEKILSDIYESNKDNLDIISQIHPDFYDALATKKIIVEDFVDEYQEAENMIHNLNHSEEEYHLTINPTMDCNFRCWYCYEEHMKGSIMSNKIFDNAVKFIEKILDEKTKLKKFHLYFFGGEPLMYFDSIIKPYIQLFNSAIEKHEIESTIHITTNAGLINEKMIDEIVKLKITSFQITLDGYKEDHNRSRFSKEQKDSYTIIIQNVKTLVKNGIHVTLRINFTKKNITTALNIPNEFADLTEKERELILLTPQRVWQDEPCRSRTQKLNREIITTEEEIQVKEEEKRLREIAKELGMGLLDAYTLDFVHFSCRGNKLNYAVINYNGDIFKCDARKFHTENREGVLLNDGTIEWNEKAVYRMSTSRLKNKPCQSCIIFPMCGGGCAQMLFDYKDQSYCNYKFDETSKIEVIQAYLKQENFFKFEL